VFAIAKEDTDKLSVNNANTRRQHGPTPHRQQPRYLNCLDSEQETFIFSEIMPLWKRTGMQIPRPRTTAPHGRKLTD
jgi:hypothetical protein